MSDLPDKEVPLEGGWGSSIIGISLTSLSLIIMGLFIIFPQTSVENFVLSLITAGALLGTGSIVLSLVSDYPLILSSSAIFLLLLFWRLRNGDALWLLLLSLTCFIAAVVVHLRTPGRRKKGRAWKTDFQP